MTKHSFVKQYRNWNYESYLYFNRSSINRQIRKKVVNVHWFYWIYYFFRVSICFVLFQLGRIISTYFPFLIYCFSRHWARSCNLGFYLRNLSKSYPCIGTGFWKFSTLGPCSNYSIVDSDVVFRNRSGSRILNFYINDGVAVTVCNFYNVGN